ncbi:unnamed protein product [Vitrella brassicaformis CCMP3155]|uniref:Uncharacterized protein n=2 Tax=Vitrella brassicaformis TaxID=1169539 RepID=A0A0G4F880_VITBC|nr:unnamed protein product [Vitrella brassicaformis CCMP3155]|eukprot:CEM08573.1 unnamed protein product [Vitrella brassicaformis CCMP3155]
MKANTTAGGEAEEKFDCGFAKLDEDQCTTKMNRCEREWREIITDPHSVQLAGILGANRIRINHHCLPRDLYAVNIVSKEAAGEQIEIPCEIPTSSVMVREAVYGDNCGTDKALVQTHEAFQACERAPGVCRYTVKGFTDRDYLSKKGCDTRNFYAIYSCEVSKETRLIYNKLGEMVERNKREQQELDKVKYSEADLRVYMLYTFKQNRDFTAFNDNEKRCFRCFMGLTDANAEGVGVTIDKVNEEIDRLTMPPVKLDCAQLREDTPQGKYDLFDWLKNSTQCLSQCKGPCQRNTDLIEFISNCTSAAGGAAAAAGGAAAGATPADAAATVAAEAAVAAVELTPLATIQEHTQLMQRVSQHHQEHQQEQQAGRQQA